MELERPSYEEWMMRLQRRVKDLDVEERVEQRLQRVEP